MTNINWNFISLEEGKNILVGYVPCQNGIVLGHSGISIGSGCDLGSFNQEYLNNLNLPNDLNEILKPYIGLQGNQALTYLNENPLSISIDQCNNLMDSINLKKYYELSNMYDNDTNQNCFEELPENIATCIMSVYYQYGNLPLRTPKFWQSCISQNWQETIQILRNFGDSYPTRRNNEADLLENSLTNS